MTTKTRAKTKIKPMTPGVSSSARVRAYAAGVVVSLGLLGVGFKAWALQVEDGEHYQAIAARQHALRVDLPSPRGDVLDAQGRPLAVSADAESIWANPREVRDVAATAEQLAKLTGADAAVLEGKLAGDRRFVWLARHVRPEVARAVREAKIAGIEVAGEPRRWYPAKTVAGPVVGRADIDGNGLDGIELSMNEVLTGKRGAVTALRDARGRKMLAGGLTAIEAGHSVKLTLDRSIQAIADEALLESITTNKAKNGVVVVVDVPTGKVLAMSSYPTYDPNSGGDHGARNRPVTDVYEAGSVMKVFTVAAALEEGLFKPESGMAIGSAFKVGPKMIRDTHPEPYLTVTDIIKVSSNIGATKIALRLGREKMYAYLKRFGFGGKSGIELPGEQPGMLRDGSRWREIELATISFGYGLTVTPLQLAAAMAAIGNGGVYNPPRIVDEIRDADGNLVRATEPEPRQMIAPKYAAQMLKMLASVFERGGPGQLSGTAASIHVPGFRCGGKTGTAHKYDPAIKAYSPNKYLSSFIGLAPIDNPRLAIVVMIDEPTGGAYYGGKVAGPVFGKVASEALRYLGVPGDPIVPVDRFGRPLPPPKEAAKDATKAPAKVVPPVTTPEAIALEAETPEAELAPDTIVIPDFRGMGVGRALDEARKLRLEVELTGSGQVIEQDPPAGPATGVARMKLVFSVDTRRISAR
jgi:cell division protein FtsI (penicillin-binding protein 3)